jgi:hypothetical protein
MTDKLSIYNGALTILGERKLASLTENRPPRYKLDDIWDNDLLERVLQQGQWNFAGRTIELEASPSITPAFGYQYGFDKPVDFVRTMQVAYDEYFTNPITQYSDEASWIFAESEVIYMQYVSKDSQWGLDFSLWPANFTEYVEHYLAKKVAPRLIGVKVSDEKLEYLTDKALTDAKATDAMESPAKFPPQGNWASARRGNRSRSDRGSRRQLIG